MRARVEEVPHAENMFLRTYITGTSLVSSSFSDEYILYK